MNLEQIISGLHELSDEACIFARKPWLPSSEATAAPLGENFEIPISVSALGFEYFLEVHVAREVLGVLGNRRSSKEDQLKLLMFYAENDAYPGWVYEK
jgi:hypothetical protein